MDGGRWVQSSYWNGHSFEQVLLADTEEGSRIWIGKDCMFARETDVRTGDSHSIIDAGTGERINYPRNITLEDHVWVAERATILKGVTIGKDAIIATGSIVTKDIPSGSLAAGIPARVIRSGITWKRERIKFPLQGQGTKSIQTQISEKESF